MSQPSATGQNWEKYKKTFADDEIEEKKITPLSDELVSLGSYGFPGMLTLDAGISKSSRPTALLPMAPL